MIKKQTHKKRKKITLFYMTLVITLFCSPQIILAMGTPPKQKKNIPEESQTELAQDQIDTPTQETEVPQNITPEDPSPPPELSQTELTPDPIDTSTQETQNAQTTINSQDTETPEQISTIVTLANTKPVGPEIQIRSEVKEQLRWLLVPEFSKTNEHYALIKLNANQTEAQIDTQTNTPNFIYIDPSRPDSTLNNGLFFWKKDEQVIETAWGELFLLRTHPDSIYTCAFKTPEDTDSPDLSLTPESTVTESKAPTIESNIKSPTPQPEKTWDNNYCVFREKENLWSWEEPIDQARIKFPEFDKELKNVTILSPTIIEQTNTDTQTTSTNETPIERKSSL